MRSGILLVAMIAACARIAHCDQWGFVQACPEGCRAIDKQVSCGGASQTKACTMDDNGNVTMICSNGRTYTLGINGCGGGTPSNTPTQSPGGGDSDVLSPEFATKTMRRFFQLVTHEYTYPNRLAPDHPYLVVSIIEYILTVYFTTLAIRFQRLTYVIVGLIAAQLLTMAVLAATHMSINSVWKDAPLGIVPIVMAILCGAFSRVGGLFVGCGIGAMIGCVALSEYYERKDRDLNGAVLYVMVGCIGVFSSAGTAFRKRSIIVFASLFAGACGTSATIQLFLVKSSSRCALLLDWYRGCDSLVVHAIAIGFTLIAFIVQVLVHRKMRRDELRREMFDAYGGSPHALVAVGSPVSPLMMNHSLSTYGAAD